MFVKVSGKEAKREPNWTSKGSQKVPVSITGASSGPGRTSQEAPEDSFVAPTAAGALQERYSGPGSCWSRVVAAAGVAKAWLLQWQGRITFPLGPRAGVRNISRDIYIYIFIYIYINILYNIYIYISVY